MYFPYTCNSCNGHGMFFHPEGATNCRWCCGMGRLIHAPLGAEFDNQHFQNLELEKKYERMGEPGLRFAPRKRDKHGFYLD